MAFDSKPSAVPEFAISDQVDPVTGQNNVIEPSADKKNYGWDYLEKPARNYFNWIHRFTYLWINYFNQFFSSSHQLQINEIIEETAAGGVTIDGVLVKDNDVEADEVRADDINEKTTDAGVTIDGVNIKDNEINIPSGGEINHNGTPVAGYLADGIPYYKKILDIGDWNMDSTATVLVAHGLTAANIRQTTAWIRDDAGTVFANLSYINSAGTLGGGIAASTTNIELNRVTGGIFDSVDFNATSYNRGWIVIEYID